MKVIQISEENHGHIGTAVSMKAAYQHLVKRGWLGFWDDIRVGDSIISIGEFLMREAGRRPMRTSCFGLGPELSQRIGRVCFTLTLPS